MDLWMVVALGAMAAGFVQGLSGFAFGLVAVSFWAWALPPQVVAVLVVFGSLIGQLLAVASVRRGFQWRVLWPYLLGGLAGVPIGVWWLPQMDIHAFKVVLGLLLALWCPAMLWSTRLPRVQAGGRLADGGVGMAGGIMGGLGGFTGALPTLWSTLRGYPKDTQRAVIQNFNLALLAVVMASYMAQGWVTRDLWPLFAIVAPAMLLPTWVGTRLYLGISEAGFRRLVLSLLTLSGLAMLATSLPQVLGRWGA